MAPTPQHPMGPQKEGDGGNATSHRKAHPGNLEKKETYAIYPHLHLHHQAAAGLGTAPGRSHIRLPHHVLLCLGKAWQVHSLHAIHIQAKQTCYDQQPLLRPRYEQPQGHSAPSPIDKGRRQ